MITIIPTTIRPYYELIVCSDRIDYYTQQSTRQKKEQQYYNLFLLYIRVCFLVQRVLCRY